MGPVELPAYTGLNVGPMTVFDDGTCPITGIDRFGCGSHDSF